MRKKTFKTTDVIRLILLVGFLLMRNTTSAQNNTRYKYFDTTRLLQRITIAIENQKKDSLQIKLGNTIPDSCISEKTIWDLTRKHLYKTYGRRKIRKQLPYFFFRKNEYFYFEGILHKTVRGGSFIVIVNTRLMQIVYIFHQK